ncbi:DUF3293 domain-containing protein [Variovorax sp. J22R133]|uniref:DUF3293 domain-containing protein n=1 Tax=Variovorax brevis TaxID=3053503 RepID=UPI00257576D0|nr:DUF3293 domain-containing protein [Variovorax sp. J22R133]MDM0113943.1 DUF3293 domain-containing protein [Variovorax sp. J22R133]
MRRPSLNGGLFLFFDTTIDPGTIRAYRETEYRVLGDTPATLNVDAACVDLAAIHEAHRVDCSAFITACNPFSEPLGETANAQRQSAFARELARRGLAFINAIGQHPVGDWPGEASFLVLGLQLDAARLLGTQHGQNAIVWSGPDAVPRLILLR